MKTKVHNTNSDTSNVQIIYQNSTQQLVVTEQNETNEEEDSSSSDQMYEDSNSDEINMKAQYTTEECMPDDGLDLYEEQTVESSYSGLTDYNILKDLVAQSVKNEGELMLHTNFVVVEQKMHDDEEDNEVNLIKQQYGEAEDPNEYEVADQIHSMGYEEHDDIETQEEVKFMCPKCPLKFESRSDMQNHKKIHEEKKFSCQICSREFKKEMGRKVHMTLKHGRQATKMILKYQGSGEDKKPPRNYGQRYECNDCFRLFEEASYLRNHLKSHNSRKSRPFECEVCFKCFTQRGALDTHKKIHLGYKPFKCHLCTRAFFQKGNLATHLKIHVQNEAYFKRTVKFKKGKQCTYNKTEPPPFVPAPVFVPSSAPTVEEPLHMKRFTCEVCDKSFLQLTNLHTHMRTHTGNRPFSCNYCTKSFTQVGNLQKHLKIHTGERPFECEICSKCFVQKCQLQKHMSVHASEQTVVQRKRKRSVPRVKVYECRYCSKKYKQNYNLKKHMEKCMSGQTQNSTQVTTKQIHFEKSPNVKVEQEVKNEYLSDSSDDNASVSGNASSDSSNDSSEYEDSPYGEIVHN